MKAKCSDVAGSSYTFKRLYFGHHLNQRKKVLKFEYLENILWESVIWALILRQIFLGKKMESMSKFLGNN